ncbi:Aurofusarin cluster transcription factor aurR2 [Exophiala dermatitidis]
MTHSVGMSSSATPSATRQPAPTHACVRCSERKVKCDKKHPCTACLRFDFECVYRPLGPRKTRKQSTPNRVLIQRLRRYESMLQGQRVDAGANDGTPTARGEHALEDGSQSPAVRASHTEIPVPETVSEPEQVPSSSRRAYNAGSLTYLESGLWTRAVEEFPKPSITLENVSDQESDNENGDDYHYDFLSDLSGATDSVNMTHPPKAHILVLWQTFRDNVDPVVKIVHAPTVEVAMANPDRMSRSFEALMFALYSLAVFTLHDEECGQKFGETRQTLLSRYTAATRFALGRAKVLRTTNVVVLQAFIFHLFSIRDMCHPRTLCTLTGMAMRLAEGMGLHRDGQLLGLAPFEVELRRRIWWQLSWFDSRTSELIGMRKFQNTTLDKRSPRLPSNIDDEALFPGMEETPKAANRVTTLALCAIRWEVAGFWTNYVSIRRQQGLEDGFWSNSPEPDSMKARDHIIDELEATLETKYIRYCDPLEPVQLMAMMFARGNITTMRFLSHHPRRWGSSKVPASETDFVWKLSIKLLDGHIQLYTNPQLRGYTWQSSFYFAWEALVHVLDTLHANPLCPENDKAWRLVGATYDWNPDFVNNSKMPLRVAIGDLCLRAHKAREVALEKQGLPLPPRPWYVLKFHQQREKAKLRKQDHENRSADLSLTRSIHMCSPVDSGQGYLSLADRDDTGLLKGHADPNYPESRSFQAVSGEQTQLYLDDNGSWSGQCLDGQSHGFPPGPTDTSPDNHNLLFDQDYNPESWMNETLDWTQWDTLSGTADMFGG